MGRNALSTAGPARPVDFLRVSPMLLRSPVARAVERARVCQAVRDFQVRLHMLQEGEPANADGLAAADVLCLALAILQMSDRCDTPAFRVMSGAMGALAQMAQSGWTWRTRHAVAIDQALVHAPDVITGASADLRLRAERHVMALLAEAVEKSP